MSGPGRVDAAADARADAGADAEAGAEADGVPGRRARRADDSKISSGLIFLVTFQWFPWPAKSSESGRGEPTP